MNQGEALQEARRKWGRKATADIDDGGYKFVGKPNCTVFGTGETWEDAFNDADRRFNTTKKGHDEDSSCAR